MLIVGGTRNLGPDLVAALRAGGARVTVLNRGRTPDDLPRDVERLRADRGDPAALAAALAGRTFDAVVDTTLYAGADAAAVADLLAGRVGRYVWLSSGQVYLVRAGLVPPYREDDYAGPVTPEPPRAGADWPEWRYGVDKRAAEDALAAAAARGFPVTTLRLPMVHSRRDPAGRLLAYVRRLEDGGPLLVPDAPDRPLRHVDGDDVVAAVLAVLARDGGAGDVYNVSPDETASLDALVALVAAALGVRATVVRVPRERLEATGLLPACSPLAGRWMSVLDGARGRGALGLRYTPLADTVARLVAWHRDHPGRAAPGQAQRPRELALARELVP